METRYTRLKDERDNVAKAKEALELHDTGNSYYFFILLSQNYENVNYIMTLKGQRLFNVIVFISKLNKN